MASTERHTVAPPVPADEVTAVGLHDRWVAWATRSGSVLLTDIRAGRVLRAVEEAADHLSWSPSGGHLLLRRSGRCTVVDVTSARVVTDLEARTACLISDDDGDVLVTALDGLLQGLRLPDLAVAFEIDMRRCHYSVTRLHQVPAAPGGALAVVGHPWSELLDWLLLFPAPVLRDRLTPFTTDRDCYTSRFVVDRGAPVLVGPGDPGEVVVYRDHDGAEDPEDADDADAFADVWGFQGFSVRRSSDGRLLERLAYRPRSPLSSGAEVFATSAAVALVDAGTLHVLSRASGELLTSETARLLTADPARGHVLAVGTDGRVALLDLR